MSTVHFYNFANGKTAFSVEMPVTTTDQIEKVLRKNKVFASKSMECCYDENADLNAAITGTIYVGGFRGVGKFRVIDNPTREVIHDA